MLNHYYRQELVQPDAKGDIIRFVVDTGIDIVNQLVSLLNGVM